MKSDSEKYCKPPERFLFIELKEIKSALKDQIPKGCHPLFIFNSKIPHADQNAESALLIWLGESKEKFYLPVKLPTCCYGSSVEDNQGSHWWGVNDEDMQEHKWTFRAAQIVSDALHYSLNQVSLFCTNVLLSANTFHLSFFFFVKLANPLSLVGFPTARQVVFP